MNVSELARRLRTTPDELRQKLPELGFAVGAKAIKVDDRLVNKIMAKWSEMTRTSRLREKYVRDQAVREAAVAKVKSVTLPAVIPVRDFATKLSLPVSMVLGELMKNGILTSLNERIDYSTASIIAEDLGFNVSAEEGPAADEVVEDPASTTIEQKLKDIREGEKDEDLQPRPPVVVVMGHVDHGKTSLLDAIRATNVVKKESGGITQHIGAYQAEKKGRKITFIDTPGHEAFTVMRSRGARVADVAVLVVAADDGVQPQTVEVIKIIEAAKLPVVVAINKIDKPDIDLQHVKTQLSEKKLIPEEWGGTTPMVGVSAKTGQGLDDLLDVILLAADIEPERLRANPNRRAVGTVIESRISKGEGPVATMLVQAGTLKPNDSLAVRDELYGRVRAMKDWNGLAVRMATPGMPVRILGLKVPAQVGDIVEVPADPSALKQVQKRYAADTQAVPVVASRPADTESGVEKKFLNVVVKTDVLGSLEAIVGTLEKFDGGEVAVKVIAKGLGNVTDGDVSRAEASSGLILAFNVMATREAELLARDKHVEIGHFKVIYALFDEVKKRLQALLPAEVIVTQLGKLEVLATFKSDKTGHVVGGRVLDGHVRKNANMVIFRGDSPVGEGTVVAVQSGKSEIGEARMGQECGVKVVTRNAPQVGDVLQVFTEEKKERKLVLPV
jgi:translation initiation factor IF-2